MSGVDIETKDDRTTIFKFTNGSLNVTIKQGDISKEVCDAIVNPTNNTMTPNGGLDTILHQNMGEFFSNQVKAISSELKENACPVGNSRIFISKPERDPNVARFIINTVGPHYVREGKDLASFHLKSCYCSSLALANNYGLSSITYPAISCGAFRFPIREAAQVGIETIRQNSYQVKDVRFVLFERHIYEAFVQEWTDYSEKINKDANVIDDRDQPPTPPPPPLPSLPNLVTRLSIRPCVLCKDQQISTNDAQLICNECSALTRSDFFNKILQQLRSAADTSFDDLKQECNELQPILSTHQLIYTPARVFNPSIHMRDIVAEFYLQSHCDRNFRNGGMPMAVLGDGNCFYNTFVKLGGGGSTTEASAVTPVELRARNVIELILHVDQYEKKYPAFEPVLDAFQNYVREEMVHDTNYVAVWDLLSIPTVLKIKVISIYPKVNGPEDMNYQTINGKELEPLTSNQTATLPEVKLMFSHCNRPSPLGPNVKGWTPNHYVPVLSLR